ncbi:MAG: DrmB family protein [Isosphaerales bacterium]
MTTRERKRCKVGELRPSQAITTFGIGSIIDLPNLSVMVMGLEDWPLKDTVEIGEQRLLASVKEVLGHQVRSLRSAPVVPDTYLVNQFDASALVGIPVAPFPRWMVCPHCRRLAPLGSGLFKLETPFRTDQIRYVHANCTRKGKSPTVVPARFIVACKNGHLDDFPWSEFVHRGPTDCKGGLKLLELTVTGEAAGIEVRCEGENCGATRRMSDAFKMDLEALPVCRGRRAHLRDYEEGGCKALDGQDMPMEPMLQGASNSWFAIMLSALAIPGGSSKLAQLVDDHWIILEKVQSEQNIELLQQVTAQLRDLYEYTPSEIWQAVQAKQTALPTEGIEPTDLKTPEWKVFIDPSSAEKSRDFQLRIAEPPKRYAKYFERIVLAERLREVRALVGFSRIESPSDYDHPAAFPANQRARISRTQPTWAPSSEIRGEGLFFHFKEDLIRKWCAKAKKHDEVFLEAHRRWRIARRLVPPHEFYPGIRFVLLHSFAHALIRQLAVECGYTTASLRERIYSRNPGEDEPEMAGVLIYTAAPDSEGTLGGLVSLGRPETLERHLDLR